MANALCAPPRVSASPARGLAPPAGSTDMNGLTASCDCCATAVPPAAQRPAADRAAARTDEVRNTGTAPVRLVAAPNARALPPSRFDLTPCPDRRCVAHHQVS